MRRYKLQMNAIALSPREKAYLLGMFLADGYLRKRHKSTHELRIHLQGNEIEIADRIIKMFDRSGLNPRLERSLHENELTVVVAATNLTSVFPDKDKLLSLPAEALRRWVHSQGLYGNLGIPFIAGLLDGDGCCYLHYDKCRVLSLRIKWNFFQSNCRFLTTYVKDYINDIVRGGCTISRVQMKGRKQGAFVTILKSGREALVRNGIAIWSLKIAKFLKKYEEMRSQILSLSSSLLPTGKVAIRLHVSPRTIENWCRKNHIKHLRIRSILSRHWHYLIPKEEVERLEFLVTKTDRKNIRGLLCLM